MTRKEVVDLFILQMDEYQIMIRLELAWSIEHWKDIKEIELQSDEMIGLFEYQQDYFLEKQLKQTRL